MDGYRHNSAEALRAQPIASSGVASGRIGTDPETPKQTAERIRTDLKTRLLQDGGEREYDCTPDECGYDGDTYCSNCGYGKDERCPTGEVTP